MRTLIILGLSAAALAACDKTPPAAPSPAASAAAQASPSSMAMESSMPGMDHGAMASTAAADATSTAETPDGHMFHVLHLTDIQSVHLPVAPAGQSWTATISDPSLASVDPGIDEKMPDGVMHHVVKVTPKVSGNADVKFELHDAAKPTGAALQTRTMHFMIH